MHHQRRDIDIPALRTLLLARRDELHREDEATKADRAPPELDQSAVGRLSRMEALQGQAMALAVGQRRHQEEARISAALQRMDDGEYGFCVSCDAKIPAKRLELDPAVPTCVKCAEKAEHHR